VNQDLRICQSIATDINAKPAQVSAAIALLDEGSTVPFIARYRKEATGGLDDTQLRTLADRLIYLRDLENRREVILKNIKAQDKLTNDLQRSITAAATKAELEDIYLPFKPKRRTKAMIAKEKGLEPLRDAILNNRGADPKKLAEAFVTNDVPDITEALNGARDILTEELSEKADLLGDLRGFLKKEALVSAKVVKGKEETGAKFADYFDRQEKWSVMPGHRALAMMRAVTEGVIKFDIGPDAETGKSRCESMVAARLKPSSTGPGDKWLKDVANHAWKAKLSNTLASDLLADLRSRAQDEAISVFARNLKDLLLAAPAGAKSTLGLDPGIRTGVKAAVIDATGKVVATDTLYPFQPRKDLQGAQARIIALIKKYNIELIAIGNGTASRETEKLVADTLKLLPSGVTKPMKVVVSEAGASVYSASEMAAREFPNLDVSLRGAVSIARRLQDPLAELVKIEPKSIGVGQYQHDVDQRLLAKSLEAVVEDAVNAVGVDLNTASAPLLSHVAGLSPAIAEAIVEYRDQKGAFKSRKDLLKVKRLGPKAFEQCAGFLRISNGKEPLDASAVHPEAYDVARRIIAACGRDLRAIQAGPTPLKSLQAETFVDDKFGLPTVSDILAEIEKPGRDPRPSFKTATFKEGVSEISDLRAGMRLEGTITNVAAFGAFVDVGVHQDGLVHVSQLADKFVKDPHEIVKAGDVVHVTVVDVDIDRKRIGLTMKTEKEAPTPSGNHQGRQQTKKSSAISARGLKQTSNKVSKKPTQSSTSALGSALMDAFKKQ